MSDSHSSLSKGIGPGFGYVLVAIRSFVFQTLLYTWIGTVLFVLYPSIFFSRKFLWKIFRFLTSNAMFLMRVILKIKCKFEGLEILDAMKKSEQPFIIACKHQSGVETVIFSLFMENFTILAKEEMRNIPLLGAYMKHLGFIFINRRGGRQAIECLLKNGAESVRNGRPLLIFPEGSRTKFGHRGKYHFGVALLYEQLQIPVVPVALNAGAVWQSKSVVKFPGEITVRVLPVIQPGLGARDVMHKIENEIEMACAEMGSGRA
jgi:1-acyl-sn-glycerol-3-phosphate acyltransferase